MGRFGFSYVGTVFLLALFVPNLIWSFSARPTGYDAELREPGAWDPGARRASTDRGRGGDVCRHEPPALDTVVLVAGGGSCSHGCV